MNNVYLLLGGNLGNRETNLQNAINLVNVKIGTINLKSDIYQSSPWGNPNQPDYLNTALVCQTVLTPSQVLNQIAYIETQFKRVRIQKWDARTMDIDIIFYDNYVVNSTNLTIPHPLMQDRKFVLEPLLQIIPNFVHPVLHKSIAHLYQNCTDNAMVIKI